MEQPLLSYKSSFIGYKRFGSGPRLALCFHGYGEESGTFAFLEKYTGAEYTFYCIDLPFHGRTEWKEGRDFLITDLEEIIQMICSGDRFTLMGFSLGGRIALSLSRHMPSKIDRIILMAPDGLKVNFWYWLATQSWLGNKFFAFTMKHPNWFFGFLKLINKLGFVNASVFKFINYYIGDKQTRELLFNRWTTLRRIKPNLEQIKSDIRQYHIPTRLLYGKHDRIILSSVGERFKSGIEEYCTLNIINSGHQVLQEKHITEIKRLLFD